MDEFSFENTVKLTESQYAAVWAVLPSGRGSKTIRLVLLALVGIVLLLTPYTLLLGVVLLGLVIVILFIPRILPSAWRRAFRGHKYLRDANTYGVSDQKLWVRGPRIDAVVPWSMLLTWREIEDWLVLSPSGIPPLYLSLARLNEEGLYGRVRALAAAHAREYNKSAPASE